MKAKKTGNSFIDNFILGLNWLLCAAILISYLAPYVNPQRFWPLAFFGLAYPMLLTGNIIMALFWMLRLRWYAAISVVAICCGWSVLNNNIGFHSSGNGANKTNIQADTGLIRVMTYNVHNFKRYGSKNDISTKHDILQIIADEKPDIINFQEFYTRNNGEYDMRDSILKIMNSAFYYFEPVVSSASQAIGIATFSRFPITGKGMVAITAKKSENACIYIDVNRGGRRFRVYNVHLQSIRFDPEDYKYINGIAEEDKMDMTSAKRLGIKLKNAFIKRSAQVNKIKAQAATCTSPYIISGDFNDTPASYTVNEMAKGLKNAFREKGIGIARTYNGDFPNFQIDYIMATPQFDVADYSIIQQKLSDHFPVRSDLVLAR